MSKARDLANIGSNTSSLATDSEVTAAVSTKADSSTVITHTGASTGVHGVAGSVVGTTDIQTLAGKTLTSPAEGVTVSATAATGTINFDTDTQAIVYYTTNASADWTLNVRASSSTTLNTRMAVNESRTIAFLVTNGSTAYKHSAFTIDGSAVTPKWSGGTAPSAGNASAVDAYSFTIVKTSSTPTYTVLAAGPIKYS